METGDFSAVCSKKIEDEYILYMSRKNFGKNIILVAAAFFAAAMVIFPAVTEAGSKAAIIIWANSIVPVLLPFFIFADFIKKTYNLERLPVRVYPFVIAFLSGYPMGAKIVGDMVTSGTITREKGKVILSYSLVTGPAFIMGTLGAFLGSPEAALVVAISHYCGAFLNILFHKETASDIWTSSHKGEISGFSYFNDSLVDGPVKKKNRSTSSLENFTQSIVAGFKSMAIILAYLIIFMIGIELLETSGALGHLHNEVVSSVLKGILEMTVGSNMVGLCNISLSMKTVLISFIVSFGGLSVIGQSVSMASGSGIGLWDIIKIKLTHGLLAGIIAVILVRIML